MRNRFNIIAVFVLIVIFPLISWIYLKKGEEWHVNSKSELESLGQIDQNLVFSELDSDTLALSDFEGKLILYFDTDNVNAISDLAYIVDQFAENNDIILSVNDRNNYPQDLTKHLYKVENPKLISSNNLDKDYALLFDTSHELRKQYDVLSKEELSKLIEHTALLLPYEKKADIKMKREKEK